MHVQVVTFGLKDLSHDQYSELCNQLAPTYAGVPGLISKVWLEDRAANRYGGILTWRDRQAMDDFVQTDYFKGIAAHPNLAGVASVDFDIMEAPTRITSGLVAAAA
jgi:quinol monooxygenase YgiN